MLTRVIKNLPFVVMLLGVPVAVACLWDTDTLEQERQRFPSALELIAGKFPRHSPAFYQWRIEDRQAKLGSGDEKPGYYDDIAVAYDKLKQRDKAIQWILAKAEKYPTGADIQYKTAANLGTFYLHSRQLGKGIEQLEKAIKINPDAHFGRERYQLYLAKYLQYRFANGQINEGKLILPLSSEVPQDSSSDKPEPQVRLQSFAAAIPHFDPKHSSLNDDNRRSEAVTGILGMMRFGHYDSPILLECLGDLLFTPQINSKASTIAARAYLQASILVGENDEAAKARYELRASDAVHFKQYIELDDIRHLLTQEVQEAERFYHEIVADEKRWIEQGLDVEALYRAKYYQSDNPEMAGFRLQNYSQPDDMHAETSRTPHPTVKLTATVLAFLLLGSMILFMIVRRRKQVTSAG